MRSIRKERESLDPTKNPDWNKQAIDTLYYLCLETIRGVLPDYESDILYTKDNKFRGYDFTKKVSNTNMEGKMHLSMTVDDVLVDEETKNERTIKYLNITLLCEGNKRKKGDKMVEYIFSIEKNLSDNNLPLQTYAFDLHTKSVEYKNAIGKYL